MPAVNDEIRLVVRGDDLGMAHAVNEGLVSAWRDGILTQVTAMVPCPWFHEGARLALTHGIPTAVHMTLTAEWDHLRWGPLTGPTSCAAADGTFHRTVQDVVAAVRPEDAIAEIDAQVEQFRATGLEPTGLDPHMAAVVKDSIQPLVERHGLPFFTGAGRDHKYADTVTMLTLQPDKTAWLQQWLTGLEPGTHMLVTHPGVDSPELAAITDPAAENYVWARPGRLSDLDALTDQGVRDVVAGRGIVLSQFTADGGTVPVQK